MIDVKKVKEALLRAFNTTEPSPERIARNEPLDSILGQYFNKASHMPKELTFEAIMNALIGDKQEKEVSPKKVKEILDQFH